MRRLLRLSIRDLAAQLAGPLWKAVLMGLVVAFFSEVSGTMTVFTLVGLVVIGAAFYAALNARVLKELVGERPG
jgi:hypothetical protein